MREDIVKVAAAILALLFVADILLWLLNVDFATRVNLLLMSDFVVLFILWRAIWWTADDETDIANLYREVRELKETLKNNKR